MQSTKKRQRKRERKRLEREEKRRNCQPSFNAGPPLRPLAERGAQMSAQAILGERVPRRTALVMAAAFRKVRYETGRWIPPGECFGRIAQQFVEVRRPLLNQRSPPQRH